MFNMWDALPGVGCDMSKKSEETGLPEQCYPYGKTQPLNQSLPNLEHHMISPT
jgi:hypothetical protein